MSERTRDTGSPEADERDHCGSFPRLCRFWLHEKKHDAGDRANTTDDETDGRDGAIGSITVASGALLRSADGTGTNAGQLVSLTDGQHAGHAPHGDACRADAAGNVSDVSSRI